MTQQKTQTYPAVFWHSDPARPDETVMAVGDGFTAETVVELARLQDGLPGQPGHAEPSLAPWRKASLLQWAPGSLKFVIPAAWKQGVFACRVKTGHRSSKTFFVNAPDPWWMQGDRGTEASSGGWLRIFGKCLNFGGQSRVALISEDRREAEILAAHEASCYALRAALPAGLKAGRHAVWTHNGLGGSALWKRMGEIRIRETGVKAPVILNVLDFGASPEGQHDCTAAIVGAMEYLGGGGGGVVYFPRGRYRIDSEMCTGRLATKSPLIIPPGITLRGEGMGLVNLWWPDRPDPLPSLIQGGNDFAVEDLSLYTQGRHRNAITGNSNVRISRVLIRANCDYMMIGHGREFHGRRMDEDTGMMGTAIELWGDNIEVTDCDIYHSSGGLVLKHVHGGLVARNKIQKGFNAAIYGGDGIIFEDNELTGGGTSPALYMGARNCRHIYYARNTVTHIYGGDREAMTFDGHGTAYGGTIEESRGTSVVLTKKPVWGMEHKDMLPNWHGATLFILDGKGAGQYRRLAGCDGRNLEIDRSWDVEPDASSTVSIGLFNGRHLFIGNTMMDTGSTIQLYPPNFECIVAGNRGCRAGNFNAGGMLTLGMPWGGKRIEPCWFHQFMDNVIEEGNGWGGSESSINGWIGGAAVMNIYGDNTEAGFQLPISRNHVLRRNILMNNSFVRISGAVDNVLVEKNVISNNEQAINMNGAGQRDVATLEKGATLIKPGNVLVRKNRFENIREIITGDAVNCASRLDA